MEKAQLSSVLGSTSRAMYIFVDLFRLQFFLIDLTIFVGCYISSPFRIVR